MSVTSSKVRYSFELCFGGKLYISLHYNSAWYTRTHQSQNPLYISVKTSHSIINMRQRPWTPLYIRVKYTRQRLDSVVYTRSRPWTRSYIYAFKPLKTGLSYIRVNDFTLSYIRFKDLTPVVYTRRLGHIYTRQRRWLCRIYASKTWLRRIYASKTWLRRIYASKTWLRRIYASKTWLRRIYASKAWLRRIYAPKTLNKQRLFTLLYWLRNTMYTISRWFYLTSELINKSFILAHCFYHMGTNAIPLYSIFADFALINCTWFEHSVLEFWVSVNLFPNFPP